MFENLPKKEFSVLGMGEVMLRLSPTGKERISQSETFDKMAGGSEMNVVAGISQLGLRTGIITKSAALSKTRFATPASAMTASSTISLRISAWAFIITKAARIRAFRWLCTTAPILRSLHLMPANSNRRFMAARMFSM